MGKNRRTAAQRKMAGSRFLRPWEYFGMVLLAGGITLCIAWLFYDSFWGSVSGVFIFPMVFRMGMHKAEKQVKQQFSIEFKEFMYLVGNALYAGYSAERAFLIAIKEMEKNQRHTGRGSGILCQMLSEMEKRLSVKEPLEDILQEFAKVSENEDVTNFVDVFCYAKRSGGDFLHIIQTTIDRLSDKMEISEEIEIVMAQKVLEQKIMSVIPMGILFFLKWSSPDFLGVMYGNTMGICVMTLGLLLYAAAYLLGVKLVDIKI